MQDTTVIKNLNIKGHNLDFIYNFDYNNEYVMTMKDIKGDKKYSMLLDEMFSATGLGCIV